MAYKRDTNRDAVLGLDSVNQIAKHTVSRIRTDAQGRATTQDRNRKDNTMGLRKIEMPSYQEGTPLIPEDQVAELHAGEAVIPADKNPNNTEQLIAPPVAVKSEKERARQQVENPGAQTIAMGPAETEQIQPRDMSAPPTDEAEVQRKAIDVDRKQGAGQGASGLVKMGLANIHEDQLAVPKEFARPTEVSSAVGMPRIETPASSVVSGETLALIPGTPDNRASKAGLKPIGGAAPSYKQTVADYRERIQAELDKATPESQERADRLANAMQNYIHANPWGSAQNKPGILGKLGHIAGRIANIGGDVVAPGVMMNIPGTEMNRNVQHNATLGRIQAETPLTTAREAEERKAGPTPKLLSGEGNVATTPDGARYQRYEMPNGSTAWEKEGEVPAMPAAPPIAPRGAVGLPQIAPPPTSGGLPSGAVVGKPAGEKPATREEHLNRYAELKNQEESGATLGDADQKEFNTLRTELTVPPATAAAYNKQIDSALKAANVDKSLWSNYHVQQDATAEEAKQAIADAKAFSSETYQQGAESRTMDKEERAQTRKDQSTSVYAEDTDGQLIKTSKYDAEKRGLSYEEMKPGDINKDKQALRMLNDVQLNTSRYTKAASAYDAAQLTEAQKTSDRNNMSEILNRSGMYDMEVSISQGGHITVPMITAKTEAASRQERSDEYKNLSPQAKDLFDGYLRTMAAVPAYMKALTGIGRSNKEMLDLELANIANPTMDVKDITRKQGQFQENIDQATAGFPNNLPGLKHPSQTRAETERAFTPPSPEDVIQTGTLKGQTVYKLKNGSTVYGNGKPAEVK